MNHPLISYSIIAVLLAMSRGADVVLVISSALRGRAWAGVLTALGISVGCFIWAFAVAIGLVSVLNAYPTVYEVITYAGIGYMLYVGIGEIRSALSRDTASYSLNERKIIKSFDYIKKGLLVNLLNPKVGVFYLAFLPQFVPDGNLTFRNVMLLASIHIAAGIIWLALCSFAVGKAQSLIKNPLFSRVLTSIAGALIIGFAFLILWSRIDAG